MKTIIILATALALLPLAACSTVADPGSLHDSIPDRRHSMHLGHFSVSLAVKDLSASRTFYEKLGFKVIHGEAKQNWLILQNGDATVGLFQGMFDRNLLTFNPGWNARAERLDAFADVRDIQRELKKQGLELTTQADESSKGPASLTLLDPDGNPVLIDQHVE